MTEPSIATFTKRIAKSGTGYLIWIPRDVARLLSLNEKTIVEVRLNKLNTGDNHD